MGSDYARVDLCGRHWLRGVGTGSNFLLIISARIGRPNQTQLRDRDLAEMGRHSVPATDLIGDFHYDWRAIRLAKDQRVDVTFLSHHARLDDPLLDTRGCEDHWRERSRILRDRRSARKRARRLISLGFS